MKRKVNKKKRKLFLLLILVLLVSVGYALLSTTLNINGTTKVKNATWNIYWDNPQVTTGSVTTTAPTIDSAKTTATFNVELEKPGDFYEFTIDAKNDGTIDGMISNISYKLNDTEIGLENPLPAYLNYTVTYSDDVELAANHLLAANSKETYKVRVEFKKNIENNQLPGQEVTLSLKFAVTYVQADGNATAARSAIHYITRQNEGQITPGDIIGIGETEDFYVISSDSNITVLLAKYNLKVGDYIDEDWNNTPIPVSTSGYGLQSVDALGGYTDNNVYGAIEFENDLIYWMDGDNLRSPYNENDTIYYDKNAVWEERFKYRIDDSITHPYIYDSNNIVYPYISGENGYVNKLISMGAPSNITGRLLNYNETMSSLNIYDNGVSIIYANNQDYVLGYAEGQSGMGLVSYMGNSWIGDIYYDGGSFCGIRPVIEIPTSALK